MRKHRFDDTCFCYFMQPACHRSAVCIPNFAPSKNLFFLGKSLDFAYLYANNGSVDKGLVPLLSAIKKQKDWFGSNSILSDGFVSKCIYRKTLFYGNWYSQVV